MLKNFVLSTIWQIWHCSISRAWSFLRLCWLRALSFSLLATNKLNTFRLWLIHNLNNIILRNNFSNVFRGWKISFVVRFVIYRRLFCWILPHGCFKNTITICWRRVYVKIKIIETFYFYAAWKAASIEIIQLLCNGCVVYQMNLFYASFDCCKVNLLYCESCTLFDCCATNLLYCESCGLFDCCALNLLYCESCTLFDCCAVILIDSWTSKACSNSAKILEN